MPKHRDEPKRRNYDEPGHHDRAEQPPDPVRPVALNREDPDQNHHSDRHDVRIEERRNDLESFDGAEDGDRGGDHAVTVEKGRTEDAQEDEYGQGAAVFAGHGLGQQRGQGEDAALPLVVRAHDDRDVLDRDDQHQRVDDERQHAQHVLAGGRHGMRSEEALPHRVERAGADVAIDDADRGQGDGKELALAFHHRCGRPVRGAPAGFAGNVPVRGTPIGPTGMYTVV